VIKIAEIPDKLDQQKFIVLNPSNDPKLGKRPFEREWTTTKNYTKTEIEAKNLARYGVLCGYNKLVVVDIDDKMFQNKCLEQDLFKDTFTVRTAGKQLNHFYFYVDDENPITHRLDVFDESGKRRIADIQGKGTQVVGPNSKVGERTYDVINDVPIKKVSYIDLIALCKSLLPNTQVINTYEKKRTPKTEQMMEFDREIDPIISYIKSKLTMRDLLEEIGINTQLGRNCECPFHASESGQCLSYDDHQYHCFHCNRGGSMFDFVMEYNSCDFNEAKDILSEKVGIPKKVRAEAALLIRTEKKAMMTEYIVKKFLSDNSVYTTISDMKSEVWIYKDGIYIPNGKTYIGAFCRAILNEYYTPHTENIIVKKIEKDTLIEEEKFFSVTYPNEIAVKNGILNVSTREITKFTPDRIFFNKIPVFYDKNITTFPEGQKFIESTLTEDGTISFQEMVGYTLMNNCKFKKAFILIGNGDNGKSVILDYVSELLGKENIANVGLQNFDEDQYSASELFGKIANINADIPKGILHETSMIKNLIAGDTVYANRKFLRPLKFKNRAKLIFAANKIPDTEDSTDGFFTRWDVIDFPYQFKGQAEFDLLSPSEIESKKVKVADKYILDKITQEKELSGFLNWVLDGLHRIIEQKKFTNETTVDDVRKYWTRKSSSLSAFIMDKIVFTYDYSDFITAEDLWVEYINYCKEFTLQIQMKKELTNTMSSNPVKYGTKRFQTGSSGFENKRSWYGLKIK